MFVVCVYFSLGSPVQRWIISAIYIVYNCYIFIMFILTNFMVFTYKLLPYCSLSTNKFRGDNVLYSKLIIQCTTINWIQQFNLFKYRQLCLFCCFKSLYSLLCALILNYHECTDAYNFCTLSLLRCPLARSSRASNTLNLAIQRFRTYINQCNQETKSR